MPEFAVKTVSPDEVVHHNGMMLLFDVDTKPEVLFVCNLNLTGNWDWQYLCRGGHRGGSVSLVVLNVGVEWDGEDSEVTYDAIHWADTREECTDALVLDCYLPLIFDNIRADWE